MTIENLSMEAEEYSRKCEYAHFDGGPFSEDAIKTDLGNRKTQDRLSTLGSYPRQTFHFSEKKQFYFDHFDAVEKQLNYYLEMLKNSTPKFPLIFNKCKKCKDQIAILRYLVQNY